MAEYDIFREQLALKHPAHGHALWEPSPWKPDRPVEVGDVGFIRNGRFHSLFNALRPAEGQSNVPEYYEQLSPKFSDHISRSFLSSKHYCSSGITVEPEPEFHASSPDDFRQVSFKCSNRRGGAILSLPVNTRREDTLARGDFGAWIVKHIDRWFSFARGLGLGIKQMEEIILVTGCDRTRSWTNVAFLGNEHNAQATFGVKVTHGPATSIEWQSLPELVQGAVLQRGPNGTNLPEDQCVFIRGFRVARTFGILPKHLKAAGGSSSDPDGHDRQPDIEAVSIPETPNYQDPLHILLDYIAERAPECNKLLVHDDDLKMIDGIGNGPPLGALQPHMVKDFLQRSNIAIHTVQCDLSHITGNSNSGSNTEAVRVAMFSAQNWIQPLATRNTPSSFTHSTNNTSVAVGGGYADSDRKIVRTSSAAVSSMSSVRQQYRNPYSAPCAPSSYTGNRISSRVEQPLRTHTLPPLPGYSSQSSTLGQEPDTLIPSRYSTSNACSNSYSSRNPQPAPPQGHRLHYVASSSPVEASNNYDLPNQQPVDPPYVYRPPSYPNNTVGSYAPAPRPIGVFGSPFGQATSNPQTVYPGISNLAEREQQSQTLTPPSQLLYSSQHSSLGQEPQHPQPWRSTSSIPNSPPYDQPTQQPVNPPQVRQQQSYQNITAGTYADRRNNATRYPISPVGIDGGSINQITPNLQETYTRNRNLVGIGQQPQPWDSTSSVPTSPPYNLPTQRPANPPHVQVYQSPSYPSSTANTYAGQRNDANRYPSSPVGIDGGSISQTTPNPPEIHTGNRNFAGIGQQRPSMQSGHPSQRSLLDHEWYAGSFPPYSTPEHSAPSVHNVQAQQHNFHGTPPGGLNTAAQAPNPRDMPSSPNSSTHYTNNIGRR